MLGGLWGYCGGCERWRLSEEWFAGPGEEPACPVCGTPPDPLERLEGGRGRVVLQLELPPGAELPILT